MRTLRRSARSGASVPKDRMERPAPESCQPERAPEREASASQAGSRTRPRTGISLLGVATSLAILAVLAMIAIPRFFKRPEVTLDNAARLIASDLVAAQNLAAYLRRPIVVVFNESGYEAAEITGGAPLLGEKSRIARSYERFGIFNGVHLSDFQLGTDECIVFSPKGTIDEASRLVVNFNGHRRIVEFRASDGVAKISAPD